jgi:hypothetical protein
MMCLLMGLVLGLPLRTADCGKERKPSKEGGGAVFSEATLHKGDRRGEVREKCRLEVDTFGVTDPFRRAAVAGG